MHIDKCECYEQWTTGTLRETKLPLSELEDFIDDDIETEYLNNEIKTIRLEILQMEISKRFKELEE